MISSPGRTFLIATMLAATVTAAQAQDYRPAFHPDQLKGPPAGAPNQVLVLGSMHLSGLPDGFRPESVQPVIARLEQWRPTAIATENVSGLQCDALRRSPARYAETVKAYCSDPSAAGRATGLDVPAANAEVERVLAAWPAAPAPGQRRHLAALFLAAGELPSALVQWLRLVPEERHEGEGLTAELVADLNRNLKWRNETSLIAAPLAARLGLERLWSVDDHSADRADGADDKAAGEAVMKAWDNADTHAREAEDKVLNAGLGKPEGLLEMYRAYNAPGQAMRIYRSDFGAAFREPSPQGYGRAYLAYWETRNLRMVSNIRDVIGMKPGTRLLAIVGVSHKAYYEAYLNQMHDVTLADAGKLLR